MSAPTELGKFSLSIDGRDVTATVVQDGLDIRCVVDVDESDEEKRRELETEAGEALIELLQGVGDLNGVPMRVKSTRWVPEKVDPMNSETAT